MKTDLELLELAAKAAGFIEFTWNVEPRARLPNGVAGYWNPLDPHTGAAMQLMAAMEMTLDVGLLSATAVTGGPSHSRIGWHAVSVELRNNETHVEMVCRAITQAAASYGKAMP